MGLYDKQMPVVFVLRIVDREKITNEKGEKKNIGDELCLFFFKKKWPTHWKILHIKLLTFTAKMWVKQTGVEADKTKSIEEIGDDR